MKQTHLTKLLLISTSITSLSLASLNASALTGASFDTVGPHTNTGNTNVAGNPYDPSVIGINVGVNQAGDTSLNNSGQVVFSGDIDRQLDTSAYHNYVGINFWRALDVDYAGAAGNTTLTNSGEMSGEITVTNIKRGAIDGHLAVHGIFMGAYTDGSQTYTIDNSGKMNIKVTSNEQQADTSGVTNAVDNPSSDQYLLGIAMSSGGNLSQKTTNGVLEKNLQGQHTAKISNTGEIILNNVINSTANAIAANAYTYGINLGAANMKDVTITNSGTFNVTSTSTTNDKGLAEASGILFNDFNYEKSDLSDIAFNPTGALDVNIENSNAFKVDAQGKIAATATGINVITRSTDRASRNINIINKTPTTAGSKI
ncbi:MAG: hypothetical protein ACK5MJ_03515 [Alphaproteobacteria bacterium]